MERLSTASTKSTPNLIKRIVVIEVHGKLNNSQVAAAVRSLERQLLQTSIDGAKISTVETPPTEKRTALKDVIAKIDQRLSELSYMTTGAYMTPDASEQFIWLSELENMIKPVDAQERAGATASKAAEMAALQRLRSVLESKIIKPKRGSNSPPICRGIPRPQLSMPDTFYNIGIKDAIKELDIISALGSDSPASTDQR